MSIENSDLQRAFDRDLDLKYGRLFVFNPDRMEFVYFSDSSTVIIPLEEMDELNDLFSIEICDWGLGSYTSEFTLIQNAHTIRVQPRMRKYFERLNNVQFEKLRMVVCKLVEEVYNKYSNNSQFSNLIGRYDPGAINLVRFENGNFGLNTLGNCACLTPDTSGRTSDYVEDYIFHNIDSFPQWISLYAGIGTIAWCAQNSTGE